MSGPRMPRQAASALLQIIDDPFSAFVGLDGVERQAMALGAQGMTTIEVAKRLHLPEDNVEGIFERCAKKTGIVKRGMTKYLVARLREVLKENP